MRIPFTGQVKLRSIIIKGARGEECPTQMKVVRIGSVDGRKRKLADPLVIQFTNIPALDFDSAEAEKPTQIINLVESKDAVEYPVPWVQSNHLC